MKKRKLFQVTCNGRFNSTDKIFVLADSFEDAAIEAMNEVNKLGLDRINHFVSVVKLIAEQENTSGGDIGMLVVPFKLPLAAKPPHLMTITLANGETLLLVEVPASAYNFEFEHWANKDESPEGVWSLSYQFKKGVNQFEDMARKRIKTDIDVYSNPRILGTLNNWEINFKGKVKEDWVAPEFMNGNKINYQISFLSLLRSHTSEEKRYACLIIKK